ncbi:hypothetical protein SRHO_G00223640 [Serrasalmus rhombeus]
MYSFSGPVVTLPLHQSSQTLPRSASRPHSHLEEEALVLSVPLSFQTVGSRPFWQSAELCGQTECSWTCCCPASRSLCQDPDHHMTQVGASQPLPRVVKHKPSSIVFSDKSKAAQHHDLIRSECRLFNNEGSDGEASKDNSGDNEDEDVYGVSLELQRQFLISHNRRDKNKARKVGPSHASLKTVQASSSTMAKDEGVTVSGEKVQSRESVTLLIRKFDRLCLHIQEASLSGSFAWDKPCHTSAEVWDLPSSDSDGVFPNYSPNDHREWQREWQREDTQAGPEPSRTFLGSGQGAGETGSHCAEGKGCPGPGEGDLRVAQKRKHVLSPTLPPSKTFHTPM